MSATVIMYFELRRMGIFADVLDKREEFEFDGHWCVVSVPDEKVITTAVGPREPSAVSIPEPRGTRGVPAISIEVRVATDLVIGDGGSDEELIRVFEEGRAIGAEIARRYINIARTSYRQWWLGSSAAFPSAHWGTDVYDSSGASIKIVQSMDVRSMMQMPRHPRPLSESDHRAILNAVVSDDGPSVASIFLADALFANWSGGATDRLQAVLLAAIACEVKIKQRLRELAEPQQQELVALILENPRDVSLAAASLLDKALLAVCGKSLRLENRELFKAVNKLFEDRNRIAHRGGKGLDMDSLASHVDTAQEVFVYLDSLPGR